MPVWLEQFAVAVCAISGALAAAGRRMDLFGVIVLAIVMAVGGGTIRDLCLGAKPVFWVENPTYILNAAGDELTSPPAHFSREPSATGRRAPRR
jgi:uncharacterized membrane protein YeiH